MAGVGKLCSWYIKCYENTEYGSRIYNIPFLDETKVDFFSMFCWLMVVRMFVVRWFVPLQFSVSRNMQAKQRLTGVWYDYIA